MPKSYRELRRAFGRWRRRVSDPNNLSGRLSKQQELLAQHTRLLTELSTSVTSVNKRIKPIELASNHREVEHFNLTGQVGVLETRLAQLEECLRRETYESDAAERAEARRLVDEVRREHDQVRVRMQVISQYEERVRRLEATVVALYDGDVRHPF